ncbi:alpha/beta hydrolase [Flagellimonas meridianipacifica]|nr:alpha/beta hydrolase [Allomuricauda pacifica]
MILWAIKIFASALSPFLFLTGLLIAVLGIVFPSGLLIAIGGSGALLFLVHITKITQSPSTGFENTFGREYVTKIPKNRKSFFLPKRYVLWLPKSPEANFEADISFYTLPNSERKLLCDIWQPPSHIEPSGLAFIYLHGSAWAVWDKDGGTRKLFRHLTAQGHVIMDVAYLLFPETNFMGMVHDVKHAVNWMKNHADIYGIDPNRIVLGGASAGGHLALLAAYTSGNDVFSPSDLKGLDLSVSGVISLYGPTDLVATYYHCGQDMVHKKKSQKKEMEKTAEIPLWVQKMVGKQIRRLGFDKDVEPGMLEPMLDGSPMKKSEAYAQFSPISYVHKDCPDTMLIQGEHDIITSPKATLELYFELIEKKVPAVLHMLSQTDHAFDLILPKISPSAHSAIYDIERFLALMVHKNHL